MDPAEMLELADGWMGEGCELARRILAYAEELEAGGITHQPGSPRSDEVASDLRAIIRREWSPLEP
jgi:hypothetical protein